MELPALPLVLEDGGGDQMLFGHKRLLKLAQDVDWSTAFECVECFQAFGYG